MANGNGNTERSGNSLIDTLVSSALFNVPGTVIMHPVTYARLTGKKDTYPPETDPVVLAEGPEGLRELKGVEKEEAIAVIFGDVTEE